jgi:hypothetical protein
MHLGDIDLKIARMKDAPANALEVTVTRIPQAIENKL